MNDDHVRGSGDLELVMYGDFECPYCAAAQGIVARVEKRLGDRLRFVFRHFPLAEVHPHAMHAAQASEAVSDFWAMHDRLYTARGRLTDADLVAHAGAEGDAVAVALADGRFAARVERDLASGRAAGVNGTPGFFANGQLVTGAFDAGSLIEALT